MKYNFINTELIIVEIGGEMSKEENTFAPRCKRCGSMHITDNEKQQKLNLCFDCLCDIVEEREQRIAELEAELESKKSALKFAKASYDLLTDKNIKLKDIDKVDIFYQWLQGNITHTGFLSKSPKLTPIMAFRIIYYLQEELFLISDYFERCKKCDRLFDSEREGNLDTMHCDFCRKDNY